LTGRFRIEIYIGQESWREREEKEREKRRRPVLYR
jgi:hypothetical protein